VTRHIKWHSAEHIIWHPYPRRPSARTGRRLAPDPGLAEGVPFSVANQCQIMCSATSLLTFVLPYTPRFLGAAAGATAPKPKTRPKPKVKARTRKRR